jgi:tRNA A37 threonylcarbamoyladenosine synthetase subunit TsaC/SUA5/YrdC
MLKALDEPLLTSSLLLPEQDEEILDTEDLYEAVHGLLDLFVDAGDCPLEPSTIVDMTSTSPVVLRQGRGVLDF